MIPACASSSPAFHMMYSAFKINRVKIYSFDVLLSQFCMFHVPVPCPVLTVASWPEYRFLWRQVRWSGIPISLRIFHFVVIYTVKGFSEVSEAEKWKWKLLSCVLLFATPWTILSMEFSRPEYWKGWPVLFSRGSSQPRNGARVSCIAGGFSTNRAIREANEAEVVFLCVEFSSFFYDPTGAAIWSLVTLPFLNPT